MNSNVQVMEMTIKILFTFTVHLWYKLVLCNWKDASSDLAFYFYHFIYTKDMKQFNVTQISKSE